MTRTFAFQSRSEQETHRFGKRLARLLPVPGVVLLRGTLGTGKTVLARGIAEGLGLDDPSVVSSPSFTLINIYYGKCPIYHVDLYRLNAARDVYSIGIEEFMGREGITIVEWAERLGYDISPATLIEVEDDGDDVRTIRFSFHGFRPSRKLESAI